MINAKPNYRPTVFSGTGYYELNGQHAQSSYKALKWDKADAIDILVNRVSTDDGKNDSVYPSMVYRGKAGEDTVGLLYGQLNEPMRMFGVDDENAFQALLSELKRNNGFLDQQTDIVGDILQDNDAAAVYAWQDDFFSRSAYIRQLHKISPVSVSKAHDLLKSTRAVFMEPGDALELLKQVAVKYNVFNVTVKVGSFDGRLLGSCGPNADNFVPYTMPIGVNIFLAKEVLTKATVLHEMAHAIELFHYGLSGHGRNFRKNFSLLLKTFHGVDPIGL